MRSKVRGFDNTFGWHSCIRQYRDRGWQGMNFTSWNSKIVITNLYSLTLFMPITWDNLRLVVCWSLRCCSWSTDTSKSPRRSVNTGVQWKQTLGQGFWRYNNINNEDWMFSNFQNHIFEVYMALGCNFTLQTQGCIGNNVRINGSWDVCDQEMDKIFSDKRAIFVFQF
jgi:hypothetical protein